LAGLLAAVVLGARAFWDDAFVFVLANVALILCAVALATLVAIVPAALVLTPLLSLPLSAVQRLAIVAATDDVPRWPAAWSELRRRPARKLGVASVQLLVTLLGATNILVSSRMGGLLGAVTTIVVAYALLAIWAIAIPLWPLLSDPHRDAPFRRQLRLAVAIALGRPLAIGLLLVLVVGAMLVCVRLIAPALVLPSLVLLVVAAYVGGVVDRFVPRSGGEDHSGGAESA
jgi:hypothetical protein